MKPLSEVAPGLLVIQIQIQAVWHMSKNLHPIDSAPKNMVTLISYQQWTYFLNFFQFYCNSCNPLRRLWYCWYLFPNQIFPKKWRKKLTNPVKQMKSTYSNNVLCPLNLLFMLLTDTFISLVFFLREITKITTFFNWFTWKTDSSSNSLEQLLEEICSKTVIKVPYTV